RAGLPLPPGTLSPGVLLFRSTSTHPPRPIQHLNAPIRTADARKRAEEADDDERADDDGVMHSSQNPNSISQVADGARRDFSARAPQGRSRDSACEAHTCKLSTAAAR